MKNLGIIGNRGSDLFRVQSAIAATCFIVGLSLGSLPLAIVETLHFGQVMVGIVIGAQFAFALASRLMIGHWLHAHGPKRLCFVSLVGLLFYGTCVFLADLISDPNRAVAALLLGRVALGLAAAVLTTACIMWSIDVADEGNTANVLSITGMNIYGAMAVGAPLGAMLFHRGSLALVSLPILLAPILAFLVVRPVADRHAPEAGHAALGMVFRKVFVPGTVLFAYAIGFVAVESFITLFFKSRNWTLGGWPLFVFAGSFMAVRVLFGHRLNSWNLRTVALISLAAEVVGLASLAVAPSALIALACLSVVGAGSSFIYPSVGALAADRCEPHERGTAMGFLSGFQDVSYILSGPAVGAVIASIGYRAGFAVTATAALLGLLILQFKWRTPAQP